MHLISLNADAYDRSITQWLNDVQGKILLFELVLAIKSRCKEREDQMLRLAFSNIFFAREDAAVDLYNNLSTGKVWWLDIYASNIPLILSSIRTYLQSVNYDMDLLE